jgi:hypothetical protein
MRQMFVVNPHMIAPGDQITHHNNETENGRRAVVVDKIELTSVHYQGINIPVYYIAATDIREQLSNREVKIMAPRHIPWYVVRDLSLSD